MNAGGGRSREPVENISFTTLSAGQYVVELYGEFDPFGLPAQPGP